MSSAPPVEHGTVRAGLKPIINMDTSSNVAVRSSRLHRVNSFAQGVERKKYMTEKVSQRSMARQKSGMRKLRDARIREMAATGKSITDIASEVGLDRNRVGKILSGEETKELIKSLENKIKLLGEEAIETLMDAMRMRKDPNMMGHAVKSAEKILKSIGALKERVELSHTFPKPTIIEKMDGGQVILGTCEEVIEPQAAIEDQSRETQERTDE